MPSAKNLRRYRLNYLIAKKSNESGKDKSDIMAELRALLNVSKSHFYKIHNCKMNHRGYLTVKQLSDLSSYFGCPIDDLVNHKELLSSTISTAQDSVRCLEIF